MRKNKIENIGRKDIKKDQEMQEIRAYVEWYRRTNKISPRPGYKPELSCIAFGEGHNLLYCQLISTPEGEGGWIELENPEVRQLVIREIKKHKAKMETKEVNLTKTTKRPA